MKWGQCPRFMNTEKIIERQEYVDAIAKEYKADGLIYQQIKFCDYWGYERASAFHVMKENTAILFFQLTDLMLSELLDS